MFAGVATIKLSVLQLKFPLSPSIGDKGNLYKELCTLPINYLGRKSVRKEQQRNLSDMNKKRLVNFLTNLLWALTDSNRRPNWIGLVNLQTVVSQLFIMILILLQSEW